MLHGSQTAGPVSSSLLDQPTAATALLNITGCVELQVKAEPSGDGQEAAVKSEDHHDDAQDGTASDSSSDEDEEDEEVCHWAWPSCAALHLRAGFASSKSHTSICTALGHKFALWPSALLSVVSCP